MIKRLRMGWCGLRGGHSLKVRFAGTVTNDLLLDCIRCRWSALIVRAPTAERPGVLRGQEYSGFYVDEISHRCPDCGMAVDTHLLYRDGKCPVVRIPPLKRFP